jgi:hypothetical protein
MQHMSPDGPGLIMSTLTLSQPNSGKEDEGMAWRSIRGEGKLRSWRKAKSWLRQDKHLELYVGRMGRVLVLIPWVGGWSGLSNIRLRTSKKNLWWTSLCEDINDFAISYEFTYRLWVLPCETAIRILPNRSITVLMLELKSSFIWKGYSSRN